ncbi:MAG: TIGR04282 family arsenosugar biosynthesis glycosyltransferase [Verrucomicrobiota bacterium]
MPQSCILFFLKYPEAGRVKTRLARAVGDAAAEVAFRWMVETCWSRAESSEWKRQVVGAPSSKLADFSKWLPGSERPHAQPSGSLGDRLSDGIQNAFNLGFSKVVCVGGDCPSLDYSHYSMAFEALDTHDVAIIPAQDGGYVSIGCRDPQPELFEKIAWSTHLVFEQTIERAQSLGLTVWVGETLPDIDTLTDWQESIVHQFPDAPSLKIHA